MHATTLCLCITNCFSNRQLTIMKQLKVISHFYKILLFLEIFGLIGFSYQTRSNKYLELRQFVSKLYLIFCVLVFLYRERFLVNELKFKWTNETETRNLLVIFIVELMGSVLIKISTLTCFYRSYMYSKHQLQILKNVETIDLYFEYFGKVSLNKKLSIDFVLQLLITLTLFTIAFIINFPFSIYGLLNFLIGSLIVKSGILQYCFYVNLIKTRLQTTKVVLKELIETSDVLNAKKLNRFDKLVFINKVLNVQRVYSLLSDSIQLINESLGVAILLKISVISLYLTLSFYTLILQANEGFKFSAVGE